MAKITVAEFEKKVLEVEEILLLVRAPTGTQVDDYDYQRKATDGDSISDWLERRIKPLVAGHQVVIVDGSYTQPHGRTKLGTLRSGYDK
ncbi:hypothetical protein KDW07_08280 [Burkholderia dolosa]|uniref:hypothetical protein n=1 Tax=Burkholderia dolosa TaxID=152500 RepID=UPI001B995906|nr:hypothetical protein [Burkholderia dolosa]MBR8457152.1 hypothetical protein [Burkholderia dolosa]MDN7419349.1 hypothetical protein [Burkholderia dolosa]